MNLDLVHQSVHELHKGHGTVVRCTRNSAISPSTCICDAQHLQSRYLLLSTLPKAVRDLGRGPDVCLDVGTAGRVRIVGFSQCIYGITSLSILRLQSSLPPCRCSRSRSQREQVAKLSDICVHPTGVARRYWLTRVMCIGSRAGTTNGVNLF